MKAVLREVQRVVIAEASEDLPRRLQPAALYEERVQEQEPRQRQATPAHALQQLAQDSP